MSSFDIDIILLENGFLKVKICEEENETFQTTFNKECTIKSLIEKYEDKVIKEFPKDLLNKINAQKNENVTNEEDLLINYITGYEENNLALNQKESVNVPEIIARPVNNPFSIFTFVKKEKALKVLKFERNANLEELKDYGPTSAYCNGNNFLFISGGENSNNEIVSNFFKIDLNNAEIETVSMAPKKNHSMIFIQGDYVFIIGGQSKDTFYYDLNDNKFHGWGKLNKNRIEPALILVNNYLYCFDNMNNSNSINEKFTFEKSDIYSQNHTWEICEPIISSVKMNQKFFGVSQKNDDIIFIGGNLDLEDEDNPNSKERKNLKYNISNNTIEESDIPYISYNFKEKTFLKYNEKINYILPDFNRHQPEVMFYQKEKNTIRFLKCYSKKKLEEKEKEEKNIRDFSPIKIGFKLNLNQPKEEENVENVNVNINLNPININTNLNNEFNKNENENKNEEIKNLNEEINKENQNEEYKNPEEEYKNEKENEENNEANDQKNFGNENKVHDYENNNNNNNLGDNINNLIDNIQQNPENEKNENLIQNNEEQYSNKEIEQNNENIDVLNEKEKEEDTNNLKNLKDALEYSQQQPEENVEIKVGENQLENDENILRGQNINVDVNINDDNNNNINDINNPMFTNNGNLEMEGKGNIPNLDINVPNINNNIDVSQPNLVQNPNFDLENINTVITNPKQSQNLNYQINQDINVKGSIPQTNIEVDPNLNIKSDIPQTNIELNPGINNDININGNIPQSNAQVNPGMDTNINTNINSMNPETGAGFGVAFPDAGNNMSAQFLATGIIIGTNDKEENFKEMKLKDPNLQIIPPGTVLDINNLNVGFNAQDPNINPNANLQQPQGADINANIQQPNLNIQGPDNNTNLQQPNLSMQGPDINTNIQQPNLNMPSSNTNVNAPQTGLSMQGAEINTNLQQPNLSMQGPDVNANIQQPNLNMPSSNIDVNVRPLPAAVYNEKGEYVISGIIPGTAETNPEIKNYNNNNNVNIGANSDVNNNMNANLNAQGGLNNNLPQGGINNNENMSGVNPMAPKLDINGNIAGGNVNMPNAEVNGPNQNLGGDVNINLQGQSPKFNNSLNPNTNFKGSQGIKIPNVEITDPKVGGNFSGNLNTNIPNNFDPKAEIKPADIKIEGNIKPLNVDNCYDTQGNFYLTGIIPSKNDNNLNESINNLSMTNLLLLQSNNVNNKLNKSKLGTNSINQSIMNTNQLNTDLNNDNKVEMKVGLNIIKEDEK